MAQEIADSKLIDTWSSDGLKVKPDISKIIEGWQLGEQPPHEYMNWLQNTFGSKLNHILKNGVALWNNETPYLAGSIVQHSGNLWKCKVDNTNSEPTDINTRWENIESNKSVNTINDLKTKNGDVINVLGYHTKGDGGGGLFYWDSASTETDNGGTIIQATGITTGRWKRLYSGAVNVKWFGVKGDFDGTTGTDDTDSIQNVINSLNNVDLYFPRGLYLINPSISIILKEGINIIGEGRLNTQFVLDKTGGTAFKRVWNPSAPNEYLNSITIKDIGIIFQHIIPANPSNYRQIALDLRHITRSRYENIYIGNYPIGLSAELGMIQPTTQVDARQGYGVLLSSTSSGDIAYSGGEVNILENIFCSGVRKGIIIDGAEFWNPGYRSASYINKIQNCEVSIAEIGLTQEAKEGARNFISNLIVQSIGNMRGSSETTYCIYIAGYDNTIIGGYGENAGNIVFSSTSKRNKIVMFNGSVSIIDNGMYNVIENIDTNNKWNFNINKQKNSYKSFCRAYVSFRWDGSSIIIDDSYNIQSVTRISTGDYNISFTTGVMENSNYCISPNGISNASGHPMNITLRSASNSASRITTYNVNTSSLLDPQNIRVAFFGGLN